MKKTINVSDDLQLPIDAVTQTFAFLAKRGAGKTYAAGKVAEEMHDAGAQIIVLDPIGKWYALRLGADGKSKGLDIPVLGGLHGDVPLDAGAGALVANLLVERGTSAVLDVSMMRKGERKRFAAEFGEAFYEAKKRAISPVHLFIEEAQTFVPQRVQPDEARMLGAFEDIVKLGRNFGIGCTLISQRPQAINKEALSQTECLVVLQMQGSHERKAVKEWIVEQGLDVANLIDTLPGLKKGEAWVWSPAWLGKTVRVQVGKKRTFDGSSTPKVGAKVEARPLAPIDLEQLRTAMAEVQARAQADDPKALKKRIAELEKQLAAKPAASPPTERVIEKPVITDAQVRELREALQRFEAAQSALNDTAGVLREATQPIRNAVTVATFAPKPLTLGSRIEDLRADMEALNRPAPERVVRAEQSRADTGTSAGLAKGEKAMLEALALHHPTPLTRDDLGVLSGYSANSGTFSNYIGKLRSLQLVTPGSPVQLTPEGVTATAGLVADAPKTNQEVIALWQGKLAKGERVMLDVLLKAHPNTVTRDELGERSGYSANSGTFSNYIGRLRSLSLVDNVGREIRAGAVLFVRGDR